VADQTVETVQYKYALFNHSALHRFWKDSISNC